MPTDKFVGVTVRMRFEDVVVDADVAALNIDHRDLMPLVWDIARSVDLYRAYPGMYQPRWASAPQ